MRALLSLRKTRFLLAGNILSHIGNGIAMISVPWLFVKQANGEQIYGYTTMAAALITMLMLLYVGTLIDKFSRKKILVLTEWAGLVGTIIIALVEWQNAQPSIYSLITMFLMGSMIYSMHFPTRFAFTQEIFDARHYQQLNGLLEIQGQIAFMVAGGVGGFLVERTTFTNLMLIDAATFLLGAIFFMLIPYEPKPKANAALKSAWANLKEGISFIRTYKHTTNFFVFTMLPFISVLIGLYLFPIYISDVLKADATVYGWHEVTWAIGSIIAGITIPWLAKKMRGREVVILSVSFYTFMVILLVLDINVLTFLVITLFMGWGNAGRRVARATVIMENVDNKMIGRMNSTLMSFGKLVQFVLVYIFTLINPIWGARSAFAILGGLLVLTCWGAWVSNKRFVSALEFKN